MTDKVQDRPYVADGSMIRIIRDTPLSWGQMLKGFINNSFDARTGSVAIGRADDPLARSRPQGDDERDRRSSIRGF